MRARGATWVLAAAALALACGGDDGGSQDPNGSKVDPDCGGVLCAATGYCDRKSTPPVCRCNEGYTGEQCDFCAAGYLPAADGSCRRIVIDCEIDPLICGDHGACFDAAGASDRCECETGYDGVLCEACADGYRRNPADGTCAAGCELSGLQCEAPLVCRDDTGAPHCACPVGMVGASCELCAAGYHDPLGTGQCTPTCATAGLSCGESEACDDTQGAPVCACPRGYAGAGCTACAPGYQDNAVPGSCRPGCEVVGEDCNGHGACSDSSGWPICSCEMGWTGHHCDACDPAYQGERCDDCANHHYRVGDGPCLPDCMLSGTLCGAHGKCIEEDSALRCVCNPGFGGAGCDACLPGYAKDSSGICVSAPRSGHTILAMGFFGSDSYNAVPYLVGIDPAAGTFEGLRPLTVGGGIAADRATQTLYVGKESLASVDVTTGAATTLPATLGSSAYGLSWDGSRQLLWTWRVQDRHIVGISPTGGIVQDTGVTGPVAGGYHHAYRAATDSLYLYRAADAAGVIALSTAVSTAFEFQIPAIRGEYSYMFNDSGAGIAFAGGTDRLYLAGRKVLDEEQGSATACAGAAKRLGVGDYATAPHLQHHRGPIAGQLVIDAGGTGPGLVTYYAPDEVTTGSSVLTVATSNPNAVLCLGVKREPLLLKIAAGAKFKAIIVEMNTLVNVEVEVEAGFPAPSEPSVRMLVKSETEADPSIFAYPAVIRPYDAWDWVQRKVPSLVYPPTQGAGVLLEVNPDSGAMLSERELEGYFPIYDMTGW